MKHVSKQRAKNLVPIEDDFTNCDPEFFTTTPSIDPDFPHSEGWEDVKYYTSRKIDLYVNQEGDGDSWVYILSNPALPNLFKIGSTSKSPDERAKQLSRGSGVPLEFKVEYAFKCFNAERAEREVHRALKSYRVNNDREFFQISLDEAKVTVNQVGKKYIS